MPPDAILQGTALSYISVSVSLYVLIPGAPSLARGGGACLCLTPGPVHVCISLSLSPWHDVLSLSPSSVCLS